jgi:polyisoprenoid-binding protein YceI
MTTTWNLDSMHSEIGFKVRHMMISNVSGSFGAFSANVASEGDDFANSNINFEAEIESINTGVADRDGHLKSADFFDGAKYPNLNFKSTSVANNGEGNLTISGDLTIKGVTKGVTLEGELSEVAVDPYGQTKVGLSLTGKIKRSEFGLSWGAVTEAGHVVLGDDIKINSELQFIKQ